MPATGNTALRTFSVSRSGVSQKNQGQPARPCSAASISTGTPSDAPCQLLPGFARHHKISFSIPRGDLAAGGPPPTDPSPRRATRSAGAGQHHGLAGQRLRRPMLGIAGDGRQNHRGGNQPLRQRSRDCPLVQPVSQGIGRLGLGKSSAFTWPVQGRQRVQSATCASNWPRSSASAEAASFFSKGPAQTGHAAWSRMRRPAAPTTTRAHRP